MFMQPWDAALDDAEWQTWIADGHDFGVLSVNGLPSQAPMAVPTHFTVDAGALLVHLARPNPAWKAIEADPKVTSTVTSDYAFIPGLWRAKPGIPPTDGRPYQLLRGRPVHLLGHDRRRARGRGRAAAPPDGPLPARRRPRPHRPRPAAVRADAARHSGAGRRLLGWRRETVTASTDHGSARRITFIVWRMPSGSG
nr:FMN-binding negative transcriptional regulator [Streptomyces bathyalis]